MVPHPLSRRAALALPALLPALAHAQAAHAQAAHAQAAHAQAARTQAWPDQSLRLVVPFAAGGPADFTARMVAPGMGERLGQTLVVESRTGAGGAVGVEFVAKARPDGLTLAMASNGPMVVLPHLTRLGYDPLRDFAPVGQVMAVPQILAVRKDLPAASLADLLALAKREPGRLSYGSSGIGGSLHVAGEVFRQEAGIELLHVPFRGAAPAVTELVAGRIDLVLADVPALQAQVRDGSVRALAVTSRQRLRFLPDLPTMAEAGLPGVLSESWYGLVAPAGTPPERVAILARAMQETLATPEVRRRLDEQGGRLVASGPEGFARHIHTDFATMGDVVRKAGMRLE